MSCHRIPALSILAATLATLPAPALAQFAPPGQELLLQQERERQLRERLEREPDVRLERPGEAGARRLPRDERPCFPIEVIELGGEGAGQFRWALAAAELLDDPATGTCLGAAGIGQVMSRVQDAIVAAGFITTRVLAAPQDLTGGRLVLTVIPGRIREIRPADAAAPQPALSPALPARAGALLNLRDIEQGLENLKRVPTAEADIRIEPAADPLAGPGESDLVVQWQQSRRLRLNLGADDGGTKATGRYLGNATLSADNLLNLNDLFYATLSHDLGGGNNGSRGAYGSTFHYSLPWGYWLLGLTRNTYTYHQTVAGASQAYRYSGESENSDLRLTRLLFRDAVQKTSAFIKAWSRSSANFIDDTEVEVQRRRMGGWEAGLSHRRFISAATLDLNLAYRRGTGAFDSLAAPEEPFGEGSARPEITLFDSQLVLPFRVFGQSLRYAGTWRAQWNATPLVPQDRFAIGGRYTVRGFDGENILSAERGWLWRNDLGIALGDSGVEAYLGVDQGQVAGPSARRLVGQRLAGAVAGLRGAYRGFTWDLFLGGPLSKPEGFIAAHSTGGFSLGWSW